MKFTVFCVAALLLAGCSKNIDTEEAVKQSVLKDIAGKVDVSAMQVTVNSVSFRDKEADAQITFSPKGGGPTGITMSYQLERQGDEWKVKGRNMQTPHDGSAPGMGGAGALPPGHPTTSGQQPLPPGHPSIDTKSGAGKAQ